MASRLTFKDILALGFMTFALFVGAGNIIFPPVLGIQAGTNIGVAGLGFMITAVGLPVITIIALARVGGCINGLCEPLGKFAGVILSGICYLSVGPLFAIPRTATVSFEIGMVPLAGNSTLALLCYSILYFITVIGISLYPNKLLDTVGHFLGPVKIAALTILGITTIFGTSNTTLPVATLEYSRAPFSIGFVNGYLTMDTLGALVFGIVIINAARSRGVKDAKLLTRYMILSGIIAGLGLMMVYLSLFKLGANSSIMTDQHANGAEILRTYVQNNFGEMGSFFLATLIFIACMVTAVGLTCACAEFIAQYLPSLSYKILVIIISFFSALVSNLGLSHLIKISMPVLIALYPPCIMLVMLSFTFNWWKKSKRIMAPTMLVSMFFGILDAIKAAGVDVIGSFFNKFPLFIYYQKMLWLPPTILTFIISAIVDRIANNQN